MVLTIPWDKFSSSAVGSTWVLSQWISFLTMELFHSCLWISPIRWPFKIKASIFMLYIPQVSSSQYFCWLTPFSNCKSAAERYNLTKEKWWHVQIIGDHWWWLTLQALCTRTVLNQSRCYRRKQKSGVFFSWPVHKEAPSAKCISTKPEGSWTILMHQTKPQCVTGGDLQKLFDKHI